jgi:phosphoglycolate phosphatase-like HAD superfamily hydrolase
LTDPLYGIDLVVFDKDGTLIGFGTMWHDWATDLGDRLSFALGRDVRPPLNRMLGFDPATGAVEPHGGLAATPMARLRELTRAVLVAEGTSEADASVAVDGAWHAPDPETLARPLADLRVLLEGLRADGRRVAIATSDDRDPTERTLAALGLADLVDATVCADDGVPAKPAPDMVLRLCATLGVEPARTAVIGDSPADLRMGRAAGAGLVVGVLTGVGGPADLEPLANVVLGSVGQLRRG